MLNKIIQKNNYGSAILIVLVFSAVFSLVLFSLLRFVVQQSNSNRFKYAYEESFQLAESGLEFYKWFLFHNPDAEGDIEYDYKDDENNTIGHIKLNVTTNKNCGVIMNRDVLVEANVNQKFKKKISARFMKPSIANYSNYMNSEVWVGSATTITGPFYATGGIRMEGQHNSLIISATDHFLCDGSLGCYPSRTENGVFGGGGNNNLWVYPRQLKDFNQLSNDFNYYKSIANNNGTYFSSVSNGTGHSGYHIIFQADGTFNLYRVTSVDYYTAWDIDLGSHKDYSTILSQQFVGNYSTNGSCGLFYFEDKVWIDGTVNGKVTIVAADTQHTYEPDVIINDDIVYNTDGINDGLTVVAEHDILLAPLLHNDMDINGVFIAVKGMFGRYMYVNSDGYYWDMQEGWWTYAYGIGQHNLLNKLTTNGSVVSKQRVVLYWDATLYMWPYGWININSGFSSRDDEYDRALALDPPPFTPTSKDDVYYVKWDEK